MGKNRKSGGNPVNSSNGETPARSNMAIPQDGNNVTVLPEENPGTRTTLQQDEDKVQAELDDLYTKVFDLDMERNSLWRVYYDTQSRVQELRDTLEQRQNQLTRAQIGDLQYQIREAESQLTKDLENAENAQRELDEANRRIHTLETGFDTGDTSSWIEEIDSGDDEHGL